MMNSNVSIQYQQVQNSAPVQIFASLQGPSEAKFGSKQNATRTYIEVNIKGASSVENPVFTRCLKKLRCDIKNVLEQLIQTLAYPKTIMKFNL